MPQWLHVCADPDLASRLYRQWRDEEAVVARTDRVGQRVWTTLRCDCDGLEQEDWESFGEDLEWFIYESCAAEPQRAEIACVAFGRWIRLLRIDGTDAAANVDLGLLGFERAQAVSGWADVARFIDEGSWEREVATEPVRPDADDAIVVLASALRDDAALVESNAFFVSRLRDEGVSESAIAVDAVRSCEVDRYLARMRAGGIASYLRGARAAPATNGSIHAGLKAMGAGRHLAAFDKAYGIYCAQPVEDDRAVVAGGGVPADSEAAEAAFDEAERSEDILALHAAWLRGHPSLCLLAMPPQQDEGRVPEPKHVKLIRALCGRVDHVFRRIVFVDDGHLQDGGVTTAWHIATDHGRCYVTEQAGRARMFRESGEPLCELDSTVAERQKTQTLDNTTVASNPGAVPVDMLRFHRFHPDRVRKLGWALGFFALLTLGAIWLTAWLALVMVPLFAFILYQALKGLARYNLGIREHYRHGCANPGVVVALDPPLIAVSTDLRWGEQPFPVVKVLPLPLKKIGGRDAAVGMRLPTVATYVHGSSKQHWADFVPLPVECATGDAAVIERTLRTFPEQEWQELETWLAAVPRPFAPGLYRVGWKADGQA